MYKLGYLKDECKGKVMCEFAGTCAKSYCYTVEAEECDSVKCKGVGNSAIAKLGMKDYLNCVLDGVEKIISFNTIQSTNHKVYTEQTTKKALCATHDVRHVLPDKSHTLSVGHYKLEDIGEEEKMYRCF